MNIEQVQRFYDTLAMLIGQREGVEIKATVTPRKEGQHGKQGGEIRNGIQECKKMRVS